MISHPTTPVDRLLEIWLHLRTRVTGDYLKIFFTCVHHAVAPPGGSPDSLVASVELLKEFYRVNSLHEDTWLPVARARRAGAGGGAAT